MNILNEQGKIVKGEVALKELLLGINIHWYGKWSKYFNSFHPSGSNFVSEFAQIHNMITLLSVMSCMLLLQREIALLQQDLHDHSKLLYSFDVNGFTNKGV
jgi:hypothetical protein